MRHLLLIAGLLFATAASAFDLKLSAAELDNIAARIYANECAAEPDKLLWWNDGERFPSLGIGHFIWYPSGVDERFSESFPALIGFIAARGVEIPKEFRHRHAVWPSREVFERERQLGNFKHLQRFLLETKSLQAEFMLARSSRAWQKIVNAAPATERDDLEGKIAQLLRVTGGPYALIDYVNFKGEGLSPSERYRGEGWGLYQVLQNMPSHSGDVLTEFQRAAKQVLAKRAHNAEQAIERERWLAGWIKRIDSYSAQK